MCTAYCRSRLAGDGAETAAIHVEYETVIASKPAPACQGIKADVHRAPVGAGLLAMALKQPPSMLNVKR